MARRRRRRLAPAVAGVVLCAAPGLASAQDEVPFVTTPDRVTQAMLEVADVGANDRVVDLGSGDGRIVITAARRFGARGLGVDIAPDLIRASRDNARAAGVERLVEFREQDLFATDLAGATVVTMYLLPEVNLQLRPRLLALPPGTRVVSHDWDLGDWAPDRTLTVDVPEKTLGLDKVSRVHLWTVPARVAGRWCGDGARLDLSQRFQRFSATLSSAGGQAPIAVFDGRIDGSTLTAQGVHHATLRLAGPTTLRLEGSGAAFAGVPSTYVRAGGADCP